VSKLAFAIAAILFLVFLYWQTRFVIEWSVRSSSLAKHSVMRSIAHNVWRSVYEFKGIPEDWEKALKPLAIGVRGVLYRIPVQVNETDGSARAATLNLTLTLDKECKLIAWQTALRVYNETGHEVVSDLYNVTYCTSLYIKEADIVWNDTFSAYQVKRYFIYFSPEQSVSSPPYSLAFSIATNFSLALFGREELASLSVGKMDALNNLTYSEVAWMLGVEPYHFVLETEGVDEALNLSLNVSLPITPRGTIVLHEMPILIQDVDGRIKRAWARVKIW
jgi:hypothetical protein